MVQKSLLRFENAASNAKTNVATMQVTDDDFSVCHAPECLFVKLQSCALTARELSL